MEWSGGVGSGGVEMSGGGGRGRVTAACSALVARLADGRDRKNNRVADTELIADSFGEMLQLGGWVISECGRLGLNMFFITAC